MTDTREAIDVVAQRCQAYLEQVGFVSHVLVTYKKDKPTTLIVVASEKHEKSMSRVIPTDRYNGYPVEKMWLPNYQVTA